MRTKEAGTVDSRNADIYLIYYGILPEWYITKYAAEKAGWLQKRKIYIRFFRAELSGEIFLTTIMKNYHKNKEEYGVKQI